MTPAGPLSTPLAEVVTGRDAAALVAALASRLDLHTVGDVMAYPPRRLEDRGASTDLASVTDGEQVTVVARVETVSTRRMQARRGTLTEVRIGDGRSTLKVTFFNAPWAARELSTGSFALFSGKVNRHKGVPQLMFPAFTVLSDPDALDARGVLDTAALAGRGGGGRVGALLARPLIPIYPATRQVQSWDIAHVAACCLDHLAAAGLDDPLTDAEREHVDVVDLPTALRWLHQPLTRGEWVRGTRRLAFDEALAVQLVLARRRRAARAAPAVPRPPRSGGLLDALDARLPFTLTDGQRATGEVLAAELAGEVPMQRLLQGEVGSGKTVVALRAMLQVVDAGGQAALLAPTEVLATQHARSLAALLGPLAQAGHLGAADVATRVTLLTGSLGASARRAALLEAAGGAAGIVVGTHALLEDRVRFADLGLVVVDEQHRFGVEQRDALRSRGERPPHLLVMTATPIPRTVAMTVFGDLETSVLRDRPAGRAGVATTVVPVAEHPHWLDRAWARVVEEVRAGRQAFVVCPRIGGDDAGAEDLDPADVPEDAWDAAAGAAEDAADGGDGPARRPAAGVAEVAPLLAQGPLAAVRVDVLHGRLPAEDKDAVMAAFAAGRTDVLVATTVVEVGVDVPNAAVMVVLDADRFGVSQLHQLRGRIGRGGHPGVCLLVTEAPPGSPARERLDAVAATTDGFVLAEADLAQRREGDVLGSAQSGSRRSLKLVSLLRDRDLITAARELATTVVAADPDLAGRSGLAERVSGLERGDAADFLVKS